MTSPGAMAMASRVNSPIRISNKVQVYTRVAMMEKGEQPTAGGFQAFLSDGICNINKHRFELKY
jgi:hypothetical protein